MDTFTENLFCYLTGGSSTASNINIFRKHNNKLETNGDISFPLNASAWIKYTNCGSIIIDKEINLKDELILKSQTWPIKIDKCIIDDNKINIFLNRSMCFQSSINKILTENNYGSSTMFQNKNIQICLENNKNATIDLTTLRMQLLKDVINNLLKISGVETTTTDVELIHLTNKSNIKQQDKKIVCGVVIGHKFGKKNTEITAEEYYNKRLIDMRLMAQHKYGVRVNSEPHWSEFFEKLGNSAVTYDLLHVKPSRTIVINIENAAPTHSKGASFILYNCARLSAIFKNFEKKVQSGVYPALPAFDQIDFSLLNQQEEWELLYVYLMQYPDVIKGCIKDITDCKLNVHNLFTFLDSLCALFSVYYRRIRILMDPREHLFPVLHARIYLLTAIQKVLHSSLHLLNISPVTQM